MPKAYGRKDRVAALMLQETAQLLQQEIKDPRVKMVTVTEVSVSPDLKNAKIFVSFLTDKQDEIEEALVGLNSAAGFIRSTLAKRLKLRYMPQISFAYDSLQTEAMRLDALIAKGLNKDAPLEDDAQS